MSGELTLGDVPDTDRHKYLGEPCETRFGYPSIIRNVAGNASGNNIEVLMFIDGHWQTGIYVRAWSVYLLTPDGVGAENDVDE